jgi:hypothetical protein
MALLGLFGWEQFRGLGKSKARSLSLHFFHPSLRENLVPAPYKNKWLPFEFPRSSEDVRTKHFHWAECSGP